ncbi:MAG: EAL domain-containing protein [Firmicutes bacterium]|nr:EAL domain-containing protein [Bacillota bacterium]
MAEIHSACRADLGWTVHPVFQPILDLTTGRTVAYEALSRLTDPDGRPIPPDRAFADAEQGGYAAALDALALRTIGTRALRALPPGLRLFVNVSPSTLLTCEHAFEPLRGLAGHVVLEITERRPIGREEEARMRGALASLRAQGFAVALDDLGDGYASLGRMLALEPEYVKLGLELVRGIEADPRRVAMVESIVHFGRRAGAVLVAEGIETEACYATLRHLGVDLGQGYLFARPTPEFTTPPPKNFHNPQYLPRPSPQPSPRSLRWPNLPVPRPHRLRKTASLRRWSMPSTGFASRTGIVCTRRVDAPSSPWHAEVRRRFPPRSGCPPCTARPAHSALAESSVPRRFPGPRRRPLPRRL